VADQEALRIPAIVAALRHGLGRRPGLIPVPVAVLRTALHAVGRGEIYERLSSSLVAEPAGLRELGWSPPVTTPEGLAALALS
jgi:UDP-glucose 4-epimerase